MSVPITSLPNSRAPTIPASSIFQSDETRFLKVGTLTNETATLTEGILSGLTDPASATGGATKGYVDESFLFKTNRTSYNIIGEGITYTGTQLIDGILVRTPTLVSVDSFPTVAEIIDAMGVNGHLGNFFDVLIANDSANVAFPNNPYIIIDFSDLNYIGNANNPRINPESFAIFRIIITNATSGSETANVYYIDNTYYQNLGDILYKNGDEILSTDASFRSEDPFRFQDLLYNRILSNNSTTIEDQPRVIQTPVSPTGTAISLQMPTAAEITASLGIITENIKIGDTFLFTVHANTNGDGLVENSYQITTNTGITLDTNSNFFIGDNIFVEPKQHNSATYAAVATANATSAYTVYCLYRGSYSQLFNNINWTTETTTNVPSGFRWEDVAWSSTIGGGTFAAVATRETTATASIGAVMTSTNGDVWTTQSGISDVYWTAITWNPDSAEFLAVSQHSTTGPTVATTMISTDAITWTASTTIQDEMFQDVAWSTDLLLYAAVGEATAGTGAVISTSPDGTTWTPRTNPLIAVAGDLLNCVVWASGVGGGTGLFVAAGTKNILISANGINWTIAFTGTSSQSWGGTVAWSDDLELFVAFMDNTIIASTDGTTWTTVNEPIGFDSTITWDIKWIPTIQTFCAVSKKTATVDSGILLSDDGQIWRFSNDPAPSTTEWTSIAYGNSLNKIVGTDGGKLVSDVGNFVLNGVELN